MGAFEELLAEVGTMIGERYGFRLYECCVDGTSSEAKGGVDGNDCTKAGKAVR